MNDATPNFSVSVDVTNPGQFFACCGLLELAHRLWRGAEGWFDHSKSIFTIRAVSESVVSLDSLLEQLRKCDISGLSEEEHRERNTLETEKRRLKKQHQQLPKGREDRLQELGTKSRKGLLVIGQPFGIDLDWWQSDEDDVSVPKTWAGRQEIHKVARSSQEALKSVSTPSDLFNYSCVMRLPAEYRKSKSDVKKAVEPFYFDARRFVHALDTGFSLDVQDADTNAHPAVELLCLIGLQRFRPRPAADDRWSFDYCTWALPLGAVGASAVVCLAAPVSFGQCYRFPLHFRDDQKRYKAFGFATLNEGDDVRYEQSRSEVGPIRQVAR
jgi:CRISPR-associated protein Csb3